MKHHLSVLALLMLPACLGGGGSGGSSNPTPSSPDLSLNNNFGVAMNNVRLANTPTNNPLVYDRMVGQAAQIHANDMFIRNYDTITIPGSDNGNGELRDIGDRVTDQGYTWADIAQLVDKGDRPLSEALDRFADIDCDADGTKCIDRNNFVHFGLGKAGTGDDQRWVLVLTDPVE